MPSRLHPLHNEPTMARASAMLGQIAMTSVLGYSWAWEALAASLDDYEREGGTLGHLALAAGVRAQECLVDELARSLEPEPAEGLRVVR